MDTTLSNITDMLSHIREKVDSNTEYTSTRNVRLGSGEIGPGASREDEGSASGRPRRSSDEHRGVMNILLRNILQPHGGMITGRPEVTDQHVAAWTP